MGGIKVKNLITIALAMLLLTGAADIPSFETRASRQHGGLRGIVPDGPEWQQMNSSGFGDLQQSPQPSYTSYLALIQR